MALKVGLISWEDLPELVRDGAESRWVTSESCGPAADLCFQCFDRDGKRPTRRFVMLGRGHSTDLCLLNWRRVDDVVDQVS
jgi:hypothetical protein